MKAGHLPSPAELDAALAPAVAKAAKPPTDKRLRTHGSFSYGPAGLSDEELEVRACVIGSAASLGRDV